MVHGRKGVVYRLMHHSVLFEPLDGAQMQDCQAIRVIPPETGPQQVRKQMMIAVPAPFGVQRNDEQIPPLKGIKHLFSITIACDGISLTVTSVSSSAFEVKVIPFTMEHTNLGELRPGDTVSLETDLIGKYVRRYLSADDADSGLTMDSLRDAGFLG